MTWQIGSAIGEALCGVLGLDVKQVSRMVIDLRPGDIATVDVTIGIPSEANGDVAAIFTRYELVERKVEQVEQAPKDLPDFTRAYNDGVAYDLCPDWSIPGVDLTRVMARQLPSGELLIPHLDHDNRVVGVKVRHQDGRKDAWPGSVFTSRLFEAKWDGNLIRPTSVAIVCEGETDAWAMHQRVNAARSVVKVYGLPSGASCWRGHWVKTLMSFEKVFLCLDNDDTGRKAREKIHRAMHWQTDDLLVPQLYNDAREAIVAGWDPVLGR